MIADIAAWQATQEDIRQADVSLGRKTLATIVNFFGLAGAGAVLPNPIVVGAGFVLDSAAYFAVDYLLKPPQKQQP